MAFQHISLDGKIHRQHVKMPLGMTSTAENFDFDLAIVGCGVGGHGAALHACAQKLKTAVFAGGDVGGTCVNRGCVPSKALLAASGRVREMQNVQHLESMGISVQGDVSYDREGLANHAKNLASRVKSNLQASLVSLGVQVLDGRGKLTGIPHEIKDETSGKVYTAKVNTLHPYQGSAYYHFLKNSCTEHYFGSGESAFGPTRY